MLVNVLTLPVLSEVVGCVEVVGEVERERERERESERASERVGMLDRLTGIYEGATGG